LLEEAQETLDPRAVGVATRSAPELLAEAQPLLVALDDVQWLDLCSTDALSFAMRRTEAPLRVLLVRRSETTNRTTLESAFPAPSVERLHVGPLTVGALQVVSPSGSTASSRDQRSSASTRPRAGIRSTRSSSRERCPWTSIRWSRSRSRRAWTSWSSSPNRRSD
jgi:hypothetical protein